MGGLGAFLFGSKTKQSDEAPTSAVCVYESAYSTTDPYQCVTSKSSASVIYIDTKVYEAYKNYRGKLEYYIFTDSGFFGHRVIVVRDAARKKRPLLFHLAIRVKDAGWCCSIEQTTWKPSSNEVQESQHVWDLAHALVVLIGVMKDFGS